MANHNDQTNNSREIVTDSDSSVPDFNVVATVMPKRKRWSGSRRQRMNKSLFA